MVTVGGEPLLAAIMPRGTAPLRKCAFFASRASLSPPIMFATRVKNGANGKLRRRATFSDNYAARRCAATLVRVFAARAIRFPPIFFAARVKNGANCKFRRGATFRYDYAGRRCGATRFRVFAPQKIRFSPILFVARA